MDASSRRPALAAARLYAITPQREPPFVERLVEAWLEGGIQVVQLRHKRLARGELLRLAQDLAAACAAAGVLFIVDDHLDVALLSGADGAHLGPLDLSVAGARRVAGPELLIGASATNPEAGSAAVAGGADYLGSGPAFATPIKPEKPVIGPAGVAAVAAATAVPVFAIGGIDRDHLPALRSAGVHRVCAIRALASVPDPRAEAAAWRAALQ